MGLRAHQQPAPDTAAPKGVGEDSDEDSDFDARIQGPEVRPEVYFDIESLLFRGFLTVPATIHDVPFVFKTLNHHEFDTISLLGFDTRRHVQRRAFDLFLAYCCVLVDGVNVLATRESELPGLADFFGTLPDDTRHMLLRRLSVLNQRASKSVLLAEAYAMEHSSRFRWHQLHDKDLTSVATTGFLGTDKLGYNWAQLTWSGLNRLEDMRERAEREWDHAKFIASSMAGKGMSKIHSSEKLRRKTEASERQDRKDRILKHVILGESLDKPSDHVLIVPRTPDELAKQMRKDMTGEKDWHDEVVARYEDRTVSQQRRLAEELQQMQTQADRAPGVYGQAVDPKKTYSPSEVRKLTMQKQNAELTSPKELEKFRSLMDPAAQQRSAKWFGGQKTLPFAPPKKEE